MVAHVIADRVADTSTTTGTSDFTVSGSAPTGYQTIGSVCSTSDTFAYTIAHQSAAEWEVGIGTYSGSNVFVRTTVLASSNSGSAVNFSAGTKDVFLTRPAKGAVRLTRVVTGAGDVTVTAADDIIVVNKGTGAATAVNLPSSPYVGLTFVIKDGKGDAGTNNITITPASGNIDGAATFVMNKNYQAAIVVYNGTEWNQITPSRSTLGLSSSDSPQFTAIELGNASDTTVARASAGTVSVEGVQLLKANGNQTVSGGFALTPFSAGTKSSGTFTPAPADGNYQYATNGGAHTLAAPSSDCAIDILYTNNGSAGAITFSGFTVGSSTGSALTTTNTSKFLIAIRRINSVATYSIYALQ